MTYSDLERTRDADASIQSINELCYYADKILFLHATPIDGDDGAVITGLEITSSDGDASRLTRVDREGEVFYEQLHQVGTMWQSDTWRKGGSFIARTKLSSDPNNKHVSVIADPATINQHTTILLAESIDLGKAPISRQLLWLARVVFRRI